MKEGNKEIFLKVYSNLPIKVREEIILDLGEEKVGPVTWNAAYLEIKNDTKLGNEILTELEKLEII
ncbi:MAG: hypothetical protein ABID45_04825 [Patescibacteria group bacterium]